MSFFTPRCRALATWCLPLVLIAPTAWAAPVAFPTNTTAVTLDGAPLGTGTLGSGLRNTVVQAADGSYHLWAIMNNPDSVISRIVHATATDGVGHDAMLAQLEEAGVAYTTWEGWELLDAYEQQLGEPQGRERVKVVQRETMTAISRGEEHDGRLY